MLVSSWSSFQKQTCLKSTKKAGLGYLPANTDLPTNFNVIQCIMNRTIECINYLNLKYIFLEVDQAIFNEVLQVLFAFQEKKTRKFDKIIVCMGGFHVILCLLKTIYSHFKDSGIIELLVEAAVGTEGTIRSGGGDVKLGICYYKILSEVFLRSKIQFFETSTQESVEFKNWINTLCNNINYENSRILLEKHLDEISVPTVPGDMSKWIYVKIDMIGILLNIVHFQRIGNWDGYLQAIRTFLRWCFALNRHNYARNLIYHYVDMYNLNIEFPDVYEYLKEGAFTALLSGSVHSQITIDQIIETTINRFSKETGGLSGITDNKDASERWVRTNPFIAAHHEHLNVKLNKNKKTYDIETGCSRKEKDEEDAKDVGLGISD